MNTLDAINEFIDFICEDLEISKPKIEWNSKEFVSGTQQAIYNYKDDIIYLKKKYETGMDLYFAITHELRHKYQIANKMFDPDKYKYLDEVSFNDYQKQFVEIDANAYASLIMISVFKRQPLFNGFNDEIKNMIFTRMENIYNESLEK